MRKIAWLSILAVVAACGTLKQRGAEIAPPPTPAETAYLFAGDIDGADSALRRVLAASPTVTDAFLRGDLLDAVGRPEEALEMYLSALVSAHAGGGEGDADAAVAAAQGVTAIRDRVERFFAKLERFWQQIDGRQGRLPFEAWHQLLNLRFGLLRMQGDPAADEMLTRMGCLTQWQGIGPFGPWVWSTFDENDAPPTGAFDGAGTDLGPGRGRSTARPLSAETCFVSTRNAAVPLGGVTWARTEVESPAPRRVLLRMQTGAAATVYIDGKEVLRRDPRERYLPTVLRRAVSLPAGKTEIAIKLAGEGTAPVFALSLLDDTGAATAPSDMTGLRVGARYARLKAALWQDDMERAHALLAALTGGPHTDSPILLLTAAEATGADPSLPMDSAYERARSLLVRALAAEPRLWSARIGLADRALDEDRVQEATALLEEGARLCPDEVSILRRSAAIYLNYGWSAEAEDAVDAIARLMPTACSTLDWQIAAARRRARFTAARALAERSVRCDVFSDRLLEELRRAGDFEGALAESKRLFALRPKSAWAAMETAKSAVAAEDTKESIDAFEKTRALSPADAGAVTALADAYRAVGKRETAARILDEAAAHPFAARTAIRGARDGLDDRPVLSDYRIDGAEIIAEYLKSPPMYDAAAVYVLDRAVFLVDESGGMMMSVHAITHLKTDEAVEKHGELSIPQGARLLRARTIKADGRILEPQEIAAKQTLSMPDLEPGDFVEHEYLLSSYPNQLFPGGFDTERFFFQDFETGFHRTEIVVSVPEDMAVEFDPRGACPDPLVKVEGNRRVMTWRTRNASPHPSEPLSPSAVEFLPSIRVTAGASWEALFHRIRDQLADKNRIGRVVRAAVREALQGVDPMDDRARRQAIYRWVTRKIEPSREMFEEAGHIIARKAGNRARAFIAMLKAAGYDARPVLVMPGGEDETPGASPSIKQFYMLLAAVEADGVIDLSSEYVPYGYLSAPLRHRPFRYVDTGELSETDGGAVPRDTQEISVYLNISSTGDATGRIREILTGSLAGDWRSALEKNPDKESRRLFQSAYLAEAVPGARLVRLDIEGQGDPERPLVLTYDVAIPGFAAVGADGEWVAKLPFTTNFSKQSGGLPERVTPLVLSLHVAKTVETTVAFPPGMKIVRLGEAHQTVENDWGRVRRTLRSEAGSARAVFETAVDISRVAPKRYGEFLTFAKAVDRISTVLLRMAPDGASPDAVNP